MRSFWTTADLLARGTSEREIRRAIQQGRLHVVRRGLLALPGTSELLLRPARVGGVATSVNGAAAMGLWTAPDLPPGRARVRAHRPEHDRVHVAFRRTTTRFHDPSNGAMPLRRTPAVVLHRTDPGVVDGAQASGIAPPITMLEHAFRSLPPEHALAILDSALHLPSSGTPTSRRSRRGSRLGSVPS